jgi:hypothetical protein
MATDLRTRKIAMPVIPSSRIVRERLAEVLTQAEKLKVLLRIATELETVKPPNQREVEP